MCVCICSRVPVLVLENERKVLCPVSVMRKPLPDLDSETSRWKSPSPCFDFCGLCCVCRPAEADVQGADGADAAELRLPPPQLSSGLPESPGE